MKKVLLTLLITIILLVGSYPSVSYAVCAVGDKTCTVSVTLDNPLGANNKSLYCFLKNVLSAFLDILVVLAIFYMIYSGFQMVAAKGNEKALTEAKHSFMYAVIGTAVLIGAWALAQTIAGVVDSVTGKTTPTTSTTC